MWIPHEVSVCYNSHCLNYWKDGLQAADFCADQAAVTGFCSLLAEHMFDQPFTSIAKSGKSLVEEQELVYSTDHRRKNGQVLSLPYFLRSHWRCSLYTDEVTGICAVLWLSTSLLSSRLWPERVINTPTSGLQVIEQLPYHLACLILQTDQVNIMRCIRGLPNISFPSRCKPSSPLQTPRT